VLLTKALPMPVVQIIYWHALTARAAAFVLL
jgi:hypothetical protein